MPCPLNAIANKLAGLDLLRFVERESLVFVDSLQGFGAPGELIVLGHPDLEGKTRPCRGLFEEQAEHPAFQDSRGASPAMLLLHGYRRGDEAADRGGAQARI